MTTSTKRFATQDFTDAGTGRSFALGDPIDGADESLPNYEHAGLAGEKPADEPASKPTDGGPTA